MNVKIKVIPHRQQRYETVGDWQFVPAEGSPVGLLTGRSEREDLEISVSEFPGFREVPSPQSAFAHKCQMLVAVHELIEVLLCHDRLISPERIDAFDKRFEAERAKGLHSEDEEPGDAADAPYRKEHFFATNVERLLAAELGVDWEAYAKAVESL